MSSGDRQWSARVRAAVPHIERAARRAARPLRAAAELALARALETRARRSGAMRGAAIVLHAFGPAAGDPDHEIDPAVGVAQLDGAVGYLSRRYALVRAADLPAAARTHRRGEPLPVALTFDDDLRSHRDFAA